MPTCQNCKAHVTPDFVRVFGDNEGVVYACQRCTTYGGLKTGEGAQNRV